MNAKAPIFPRVIARLARCPEFMPDISKVDITDFEGTTLTAAGQCAARMRFYACDAVIRRARVHNGTDDDIDQALASGGYIRIGRFVESDHPQALSWDGHHEIRLTAKGYRMAERIVAYEKALHARHNGPEAAEKWEAKVKGYASR